MSTALKFLIKSISSDNTEQIAELVGQNLRGGEVIVLNSDLGGGKTTFTRGLLRGMGSKDVVSSPTFTISKIYKANNLTVHHFDFYRLNDPGIIANELAEVIQDTNSVVVIEWAKIVQNVLPQNTIYISIDYDSEGSRIIRATYNKNQDYLIKGLK